MRRQGPLVQAARAFAADRSAMSGLLVLLLVIVLAVLAPVLYPVDPMRIVGPPEVWPFKDLRFPLGTDSLGRDIMSLIVHGARSTLAISMGAAISTILLGIGIGASAGYFGGKVDDGLMWLTELFQSIPSLIFALAIVSIIGGALVNVVIAIALVSWTPIARLTRAEFMAWRNRDFVSACMTMGMGDLRLIVAEILPNAIAPIIGISSLTIASAILFESTISFLGLGDPTTPTWGRLIGEGRTLVRTSWYVCAIPGFSILFVVFALALVGNGVSDAFNPKLSRRNP